MTLPQSAIQRLSDFVERQYPILNAPGIAIGLTDRNGVLFAEGFGLANRETGESVTSRTLFQIGSISKSFTTILLLQLQEQGMLDINDPVTKYLPWFEIQSEYKPITLRHLMNHSAAIINGSDESLSAYMETWNLRRTKASAPPGEMFHYSNNGYKVLGVNIEKLMRERLGSVLRERIFEPLDMHDSLPVFYNRDRGSMAVGYSPFFDDRPLTAGGPLAPAAWYEYDSADGSICSSAEDMCKYLQMLLKNAGALLSLNSFRQLIEPTIPTGDNMHGEHYGLGLAIQQIEGHKVVCHSGGMVGYAADLLADMDSGFGVVVLTNGPSDPEKFSRYALKLLKAVQRGDDLPDPAGGDPYVIKDPEVYQGEYRFGDRVFRLNPTGSRLFLEIEGSSVMLEPHEENTFLVPLAGFDLFPLQIIREADKVTEIYCGAERYVRDGDGEDISYYLPAEWSAYPGYYRTYNPWLPSIRIVQQKDGLVLFELNGDCHPLHPLEPGLFRVGKDPRSPEYIRFGVIIEGKAVSADFSGGVYSRMFA